MQKACTKCGKRRLLSKFYPRPDRSSGYYTVCKICTNKRNCANAKRKRALGFTKKYQATPGGRYSLLKNNAKKRSIEVVLTVDQYKTLIKDQTCYYCDSPLPEYGYGLDRIDNTKSYTLSNVRPCCTLCNRIKSDLTEKDLYLHCLVIVNKLKDVYEN